MFSWRYVNGFIFYILDTSGTKLPVSEWERTRSEFLAQFSILSELCDNGLAEYSLDSCHVETSEILKLNVIDKLILGLPESYPYEIYIESDGQLNQSNFKFKYGFYDFTPNGNRLPVERNGPIIRIEERSYTLSENQFLICNELDKFNLLTEPERTIPNNLKCFADIKLLSVDASSLLDGYLQNQNVYYPDKIKLNLSFSQGELEIIPDIGIENEAGFTRVFDSFNNIREVYPVKNESGGTTRVFIDGKQKRELQNVKANRRIIDKNKIEEIVEHPESFFHEEIVDLSVFYSSRVKEIGIYKPKFYPFISPYKSQWIPGIEIQDKTAGTKRIYIKDEIDLEEFKSKKNDAKVIGKQSFEWGGADIPISVAEDFIIKARKQFESPGKPAKEFKEIRNDEVLIIKENAQALEYTEKTLQPDAIEHTFSKVDNLNRHIVLKDHQIEGVAWLQSMQRESLCGCLLADDMGLGKTLQILYFIEWHAQFNNQSLKPYLIVAPVTLLENWENEYKKYFSRQSLPLRLVYGDTGLSRDFKKEEVEELQRKQIILTNYETLKLYQFNLCAVNYSVVVLDEAQKIKTPGTLVTNVSKALKADFKIAMTGTPVENTLVDLWCIMDFSVPGLLGNAKDFAKEFQSPLKEEGTDAKELSERLRNKIGIFIKRRLKKDVAKDLPNKYESNNEKDADKFQFMNIKKPMPLAQLERYKIEIERARNTELEGAERRNQILKSIWAIRDISDHPFLVDNQIDTYSTEELVSSSAKLQVVMELLSQIEAKNEKVIVFADRRATQKMLQKVIFDSFGLFPRIVNGDTPSTKKAESSSKLSRQQAIDRYQSELGFNVIVMSPLAAGIGLNVTEANHVIHYTRHWNPAKEEQATDRAYRIGQKKDVHVYYPMAVFPDEMRNDKGNIQRSFDETLEELLAMKKALASSTLFPSELAEVKPDELFGSTFGFKPEGNPTPLTVVEIDKLFPNLFEAFIAKLYAKQGFQVFLTPNSNDKGVDVVALSGSKNWLFQAKQSRSQVGNDGVQEIFAARNYYESKFNTQFELAVISNNDFGLSARTLATANQVELIDRDSLGKMMKKNSVSIQEVIEQDSLRMDRI
jgi:SNF2 family DNA or RNA helicase/HJR/Mrr/RecB family endonuclease